MCKTRYEILKEINLIYLVQCGIISTFTLQKVTVYEYFKHKQEVWERRGVKTKAQAINDTVIQYGLTEKTIYGYINEMEEKI